MTVKTFTLDNGMQLLLEENRSAPVISFNALVKVGSSFETDAEAGMCHVIEHMLFKGTPTRPVGAIARDIEAAGGEINAYTSFDQTVYYINMAMRFADRGLAILADALQHPLFDENELAREKEVILEEIRREKDNPGRMVGEIRRFSGMSAVVAQSQRSRTRTMGRAPRRAASQRGTSSFIRKKSRTGLITWTPAGRRRSRRGGSAPG